MVWMLLLTTIALAGERTMGYVIYESPRTDVLAVYYDDRYYMCTVRESCDRLAEGKYFVPSLDFSRSRELVEYVGESKKLSTCVLRDCELIR